MSGEKRPEEPDAPAATPWTGGETQAGADAPQRQETEGDDSPAEPAWPGAPTADSADSVAREAAATPEDSPLGDAERARDAQAEAALETVADAEVAPERTADAAPVVHAAPTERRGGFAGKALTALILLIAGGAAAIWAAPKVAPMLPAEIAAWLQPATQGPDMAAVEKAIDSRVAALPDSAAATDAAAAAAAEASSAAETALAAVSGATDRLAELSGRLDALAAKVAELEARPAGAGGGDGRLAARVEALEKAGGGADPAALKALSDTVASLRAQVAEAAASGGAASALASRLDSLEAARAADLAEREAAVAEAEQARRTALITAAKAEIDRAMALGEPFEGAVAEAEAAGATVPEDLAAAAAAGAPTRERLKADFAPAAHAAISAALTAEAESDGMLQGVLARFEARVTGLPEEAIEGDSAAAVLSRARAALLGGDLDAAIAGVEALPPAAQESMAEWTEGARRRRDAEAALADWRIAVGAQ